MKVAFVGKMRSGKDTAGAYLIRNHWITKLAFGDEIRKVITTYFPHLLQGNKPRKVFQKIGQLFREFDKDVWVKQFNFTYRRFQQAGNTNFVVTDVRQMNEVEFLKEQGFVIVKVETDEELRLERIKASGDLFAMEDLNHETELAVDTLPYDYLITNNTTLDDLYKQIDYILQEEF